MDKTDVDLLLGACKGCLYKNECPSRSGWCDADKIDYARCIPFLINAYYTQKIESVRLSNIINNLLLQAFHLKKENESQKGEQ